MLLAASGSKGISRFRNWNLRLPIFFGRIVTSSHALDRGAAGHPLDCSVTRSPCVLPTTCRYPPLPLARYYSTPVPRAASGQFKSISDQIYYGCTAGWLLTTYFTPFSGTPVSRRSLMGSSNWSAISS